MLILILILMLGIKLEMGLAFYILVVLDAILWILYKSIQLDNYIKQKEAIIKVGNELDKALAKLDEKLKQYDEEHDAEGNITKGNITEKVTPETKDDK